MVEDRPDDDRTDVGVIILDSEKVDDEVEGSIIKIAFVNKEKRNKLYNKSMLRVHLVKRTSP